MFRSAISAQVTRSSRRSTAGGTLVSEAAAKKMLSADADLDLGEPAHPQHRGRRVSPQPLDEEEIAEP